MEKIRLGNSSLEVTQLGLGCINFGSTVPEKECFAVLDSYVENGGNLLDTANNYAFWNENGKGHDSERVIGKWLESTGCRDSVILATKIGAMPAAGTEGFGSPEGLSREAVFRAVEESLECLKTEYIDLLYLHIDDYSVPQEETLEALDALLKRGCIREIGCSNFRTWRIESARNICSRSGYRFFCAVQQRFSYLSPSLDYDFSPQVCADPGLSEYIDFYKDLTMVAHTPLLYGQYSGLTDDYCFVDEIYDTASNRKKMASLLEYMKSTGVTNPVPWILGWIGRQFGGTVVLSTTRNPEHLVQNIRFLEESGAPAL